MTMEQLAARLGSSRQSVSQWERGLHRPGGPTRILMSHVLDFPLEVVESWFPERVAA